MWEIIFVTFVLLVLGHFIADYVFQTDFIAKFKCPNSNGPIPWYYVMTAHVATHTVAVYLITGSLFLGVLEFVAHYITDVLKCLGVINIHTDQFIHIACKILWCGILAYWATNV